MGTLRTCTRLSIPPLVMAVLLFVPKMLFPLSAPLLVSAAIFLLLFSFAFFWGCVWLSAALSRLVGITGAWALLALNALVQFFLTTVGSTSVNRAMHSFDRQQVLRDAFEQTAAFVVAYLTYRWLSRPPLVASAHPAPNNRWRGP